MRRTYLILSVMIGLIPIIILCLTALFFLGVFILPPDTSAFRFVNSMQNSYMMMYLNMPAVIFGLISRWFRKKSRADRTDKGFSLAFCSELISCLITPSAILFYIFWRIGDIMMQ